MTTIAFDGRMLAADTQITSSWASLGHSKLYRFHDGSIGAFAGDWGKVQAAMRFLDGLADECPTDDWDAIVIHPGDRVEYIHSEGCRLDITGKPYAIGSGSEFALGAMGAGKDAREAVVIAAVFDPNTGGDIETVKVSDVLAPARRKTSRSKTTKR